MEPITMNYSMVPHFLREPGVLTGYRKTGQGWSFYLKSIFKIHNESLNIWTHIIAICWHLLLMHQYIPICNLNADAKCGTVYIFSICCLLSTSLSVLAHIFHTKSSNLHQFLFLLDYVGVSMYGYVTGLIAIQYFSDAELYRTISPFFFITHWVFCLLESIVMCVLKLHLGEKSGHLTRKWTIILMYALHAVLISSTVAGKYWRYLNGDTTHTASLTRFNWIYLTFTLEGLAYACHVPEVMFPGSFDIVGQSHQIFHVIATVTQTLQIQAVHSEIQLGNASYVDQDATKLGVSTALLFIACVTFIFVLGRGSYKTSAMSVNKKKS